MPATTDEIACQGCEVMTKRDFQCPLCQAEGVTDRGYFCSQDCFAKNWLVHRNTFHKSGVVREKKKATAREHDDDDDDDEAGAAVHTHDAKKPSKKRARDADSAAKGGDAAREAEEEAAACFMPWPPLPSAEVCAKQQWATVSPPLPLDVPRAVVSPSAAAAADAETFFWPALLAAAQYTAQSISPAAPRGAQRRVLVVAGDAYSAHAFAWAARCVGLTGLLQLAVSADTFRKSALAPSSSSATNTSGSADSAADAVNPASFFTRQRRIVVATAAVVRAAALQDEAAAASAVSGAASLWLAGTNSRGSSDSDSDGLLIALPDVEDAADLQGVRTRAVFFTGSARAIDAEEDDEGAESKPAYTYSAMEVKQEDGRPLRWAPVMLLAPGTSFSSSLIAEATAAAAAAAEAEAEAEEEEEEEETEEARENGRAHYDPATAAAARLDNALCTSFANGDLASALQCLVRLYQQHPGHLESALFYLLCCNWGAADLVHAHHRLAYMARYLADQSTRFQPRKNATLADAALRAIMAVVKLLPCLVDAEAAQTAEAASTSHKDTGASAKANKKKAQKRESTAAAAGASAVGLAAPAFGVAPLPTLATTTRPAAPVEGVSAPTAQELARYANYYTHLPNLQLQATVCHLFPIASPAVLDALARAWGLFRFLPGPASLEEVTRLRSAAALRVRHRYTTKLDAHHGEFYVTLMQFVYDAVGPYSLTIDEVRRRLVWDLTLAHDAGSLEAFLQSCALLPTSEGLLLPAARKQKTRKAAAPETLTPSAAKKAQALSSRQGSAAPRETAQSRTAALRCFDVKTLTAAPEKHYGFVELPWKPFPITGTRARQVSHLHHVAVEEVLMAMPRVPRPMYIGDVGNLIGKWSHFNARFDGTLGVTLQVFLEAHPEAFRVMDRLVTRRTAGTTEPIRIRFDGDEEHMDDSDDEDGSGRSRKNRDRQLLTGKRGAGKQAIELPARARKKRAIKEFNKARFNRNYKSVDASARVPGYVKHAPRRIKGRGKKANKRTVKRGN